MSIFKCKMCGGTIEFEQGATVGVCDSCGTKQTLPRLDDDRRANLYDRANHFRRANEFDKASGIYEQILNEDPSDAEAYWSLVLCRYGIEYVEDPATRKRVPTVNRAQFTSVFDDDNYKSALQYADGYQRALYEEEANAINEIQKGILAISQKEEPFDVFICYKETDNNGRRTPDSVLANDLYHQLTNEGFKVFFSRITLEDKLGTAYEPYIFAALNSAKVMVVLGTRAEYFNAVWVKNEWSRYLALVKASGGKKVLIPAYRDMDPYDLPEEFSHLQAQDMSKLGFMQDLIRGIKKITEADAPKEALRETVVVNQANANTAPLLKRAFMYLEDGNWGEADAYCERVLDQDPENAQAYLGKLMAELKLRKEEDFANLTAAFDKSANYQKAIRFGNEALGEKLRAWNENAPKEGLYRSGEKTFKGAFSEETFKAAAQTFAKIPGYKDADELREKALARAEECRKDGVYKEAQNKHREADRLAADQARLAGLINADKDTVIEGYTGAKFLYQSIPGWRDADEKAAECESALNEYRSSKEAMEKDAERKAEEARIAVEKKKKKARKIAAILIPAVAILTAIAILLPTMIIPAVKYNSAMQLIEKEKFGEAALVFEGLAGYKDSKAKMAECKSEEVYHAAAALMSEGKYEEAIEKLQNITGFKDSEDKIAECEEGIYEDTYQTAVSQMNAGRYEEAITLFRELGVYKDSADLIDQSKYEIALSLMENGDYDEAIDAFTAMNGYGDSVSKIEECKTLIIEKDYQEALALADGGEYGKALDALRALNGYKDSEEMVKQIEINSLKNAQVGSSLFFGTYEQDNNSENGQESIEWIVLAKENGKALLLSKYALDYQPYNTTDKQVTWETCSLRKWLNQEFWNTAFTNEEKAMIPDTNVKAEKNPSYSTPAGKNTIDKVFLLSIQETKKYVNKSDMICGLTVYTGKGVRYSTWWWLRSPGNYSNNAALVLSDGSVGYEGYYVADSNDAVRPALWINLGATG